MKRTAIALALIAALFFPLTSYAGVLAIPIGSIRFPGLGDTTARPIGERVIELRTMGLRGLGVVDCEDDHDCLGSGLDGATVGIGQDLLLHVEVGSGAVSGFSRGSLLGPKAQALSFEGNVDGKAECTAQPPKSCQEVEVRLRLRGSLSDSAGVVAGQITLLLRGQLALLPGEGVEWTRLRGQGTLVVQTP